MAPDVELESWRRHWQAAGPVPPDLKGRVERETRRMRRFVVTEVIVTIVFGGGSVAWFVLSHRTDARMHAIGIWAFIAAAWTISFLLRRDAWAPAALSTAAFLDLSILRCRRRREAVIAQSVLYAMILAFDLAWIYLGRPEHTSDGVVSFLTSSGFAWVWLVTAALAVAAVRQRQRLARELETLTKLRRITGDGLGNAEAEGGIGVWDSRLKTVKRSARKKLRGGLSARN
jgi:hypothetical protein